MKVMFYLLNALEKVGVRELIIDLGIRNRAIGANYLKFSKVLLIGEFIELWLMLDAFHYINKVYDYKIKINIYFKRVTD